MKTEQEHLRELIDALAAAESAAKYRFLTAFRIELRRASAEAAALNFYRNQPGWGIIAANLDTASKIRPFPIEAWPKIKLLLQLMQDKVQFMANKGVN